MAILISLTNFTSAGQFAGTNLIIANASLMEIALTTFVINIRYLLMSLSLSQKIMPKMPALERYILAFGITDETFAIASLEHRNHFPVYGGADSLSLCRLGSGYSLGSFHLLCTAPHLAKLHGHCPLCYVYSSLGSLLPKITGSFSSDHDCGEHQLSFRLGLIFEKLSGGWNIIIATIIASTAGAVLFPRKGDDLG